MQQNSINCPICGRELGDEYDEHHLIPKTFRGKVKDKLHKICHQKIHSCISERELNNYFNTWERIKEHHEIKKFIEWVNKKPIDFYVISKDSNERNKKRKNKWMM